MYCVSISYLLFCYEITDTLISTKEDVSWQEKAVSTAIMRATTPHKKFLRSMSPRTQAYTAKNVVESRPKRHVYVFHVKLRKVPPDPTVDASEMSVVPRAA